jgi:hypothetical protein
VTNERLVPAADLSQPRAQRREPLGEARERVAVVLELIPVGVDRMMLVAVAAVEDEVDHRQRSVRARKLDGGARRLAERVFGESAWRAGRAASSPCNRASAGRPRAFVVSTQSATRRRLEQLLHVMHLDHAHALAAEGAHRIGLADVEHVEGEGGGAVAAQARERAARPALGGQLAVVRGEGDLDVAIVLLRDQRVADALHQRELSRFPGGHQRGERGMESVPVGDLEHRVARHCEVRPYAVIASGSA